jgi:hypothetical protein
MLLTEAESAITASARDLLDEVEAEALRRGLDLALLEMLAILHRRVGALEERALMRAVKALPEGQSRMQALCGLRRRDLNGAGRSRLIRELGQAEFLEIPI